VDQLSIFGDDSYMGCQRILRTGMVEPSVKRRELIEKHVLPTLADPIRSVKAQGLEGLVAKRRNSSYEPGVHSGAWQKMRVNRGQEFVIAGHTPSLKNFDRLVIGYYEGDRLNLRRPDPLRLK